MKTFKQALMLTAMCLIMAGRIQAQEENAKYISQSTPGEMDAGKTYSVSVTMKNTGTKTWYHGSHSLKIINVPDAYLKTWGVNKVDVNSTVAPGEQVVFNFTIKAPDTPAAETYTMQWQMANGNAFFGEPTAPVPVTVSGISEVQYKGIRNNSVFTSQKISTEMDGGSTYSVSMTAKNTGVTTWKPGEVKLKVTAVPTDNSSAGWTVSDVDLPYDVVPNSEVTFLFNVTPPNSSGAYNFQTQFYKDGTPFGEASSAVTINVN